MQSISLRIIEATKAAGWVVGFLALFITGCSIPQSRMSQQAWSATADREQEQQQLRVDPQGDRDLLPESEMLPY